MERRKMRVEVIDEATAEMFRRMSPAQRVSRGLQMADFARRVIRANVLAKHPQCDAARIDREVARRFVGE